MLNEFFYGIAGDSPGPGPEPEAYVINRSLRFNSEDSALLELGHLLKRKAIAGRGLGVVG